MVATRRSRAPGGGWRTLFVPVVAAVGLIVPATGPLADGETAAKTAEVTTRFSRLVRDEQRRPEALEVAVVGYTGRNVRGQFRVDLISAVHVGEALYYEALNTRFRDYDVVLYELIANPDSAAVTDPGSTRGGGALSGGQRALTQLLDLEFQLDGIDYSAANFVHADMSPGELSAAMEARGESLGGYVWQSFRVSLKQQMKDPYGGRALMRLWSIATSDQDSFMKSMLAYELANADDLDEMLGGSDTAIIAARNVRALDVLREQLDGGARRVGIFYGVGHMADFERRLTGEWGLEKADTAWLTAWQLRGSAEAGTETDE
ncbi:MAG: hypothetical protein AAFX58_03035 [Pseudomonadota bacterium]